MYSGSCSARKTTILVVSPTHDYGSDLWLRSSPTCDPILPFRALPKCHPFRHVQNAHWVVDGIPPSFPINHLSTHSELVCKDWLFKHQEQHQPSESALLDAVGDEMEAMYITSS